MRLPSFSPAYRELYRRLDAVREDPANAHLTETEMHLKLNETRDAYMREIGCRSSE